MRGLKCERCIIAFSDKTPRFLVRMKLVFHSHVRIASGFLLLKNYNITKTGLWNFDILEPQIVKTVNDNLE